MTLTAPTEHRVVDHTPPSGWPATACMLTLSGHGLATGGADHVDRARLRPVHWVDLTGPVATVVDGSARQRLFHHDPERLRWCRVHADRVSWDGALTLVVDTATSTVVLSVDDADDPIEPLCQVVDASLGSGAGPAERVGGPSTSAALRPGH